MKFFSIGAPLFRALFLSAAFAAMTSPAWAGKCEGGSCNVCTNCTRCQHCHRDGGTCSVCGSAYEPVPSYQRQPSQTRTNNSTSSRSTRKATSYPVGSGERKAILNTLRKPVEKEMKQKVVFYDVSLKVSNGWAYVQAIGKDTTGKPLKRWDPHIEPTTIGLLKKQNGKWRVVYWGASTGTDAIDEARTRFPQAPRAIFPQYT